jgi:hypothetical protein
LIVKKPFLEEALALLREADHLVKQVTPDAAFRIYSSEFGPFDTIAVEQETASLSAYERQWADFGAALDTQLTAWFTRGQEITELGGSNEIWRLVD